MATDIKEIKKRQKAAKKAAATRKAHEAEAEKKRQLASQKRSDTIERNRKLDAKKVATKLRQKKFNEFTSKPIVWIFAIFGWGHALYYLFKLVVLVLKALGYM